MDILLAGSISKILESIAFNSGEIGKIDCKNVGSFLNARYVESSYEALFHGFRPQVRLTRIMPRLQMSFGAEA
jgi:hypothetical protein